MNQSSKKSTRIHCPICDEGYLVAGLEKNAVEYRGVKRELPLLVSDCDTCGSETATADQVRQNKRVMVAFKKEVDGLLTGAEVRALRKSLNINQEEAARMFGGGPVAFSKYEKDDVVQSESMNKLLCVARKFPLVAVWLAKESGAAHIASRIGGQRFPCFDSKSFVSQELSKPLAPQKNEDDFFQSLKIDGNDRHEDLLDVG